MFRQSKNVLMMVLCLMMATVAMCAIPPPIDGPHLVPQPRSLTFGSEVMQVSPSQFSIETSSTSSILLGAIERYRQLLFSFGPGAGTSGDSNATLIIKVGSESEVLQLGISENYTLSVNSLYDMTITADTVFGAMHALETFSQLISYDLNNNTYTIANVPIQIDDYPRFPWRGIQIDTGRHFMPTNFLLHIIEACAYNKLNVLHWHVVDAESFSAQVPSMMNITELGAFYNNEVAMYTPDQIQEIVAYGLSWGVRIVPEFDVPAHTFSWSKAFPEVMAVCPSYTDLDGMPMTPALDLTYEVINTVYTDMAKMFIDTVFHSGGDEVPYSCWQEDPTITAFMKDNKLDSYTDLETYFQDKITGILDNNQRTKMIWQDPWANGCPIRSDTIIQVWQFGDLQKIVNDKLRAVASFSYYLDMQSPIGVSHYEFEDTWQDFYSAVSDPQYQITTNADYVIGGEACMWGEQVDQRDFDVRVFPRTVAIAERLWSDVSVTDVNNALARFNPFSCHIANRGIQSGPLFPDWCLLLSDFADNVRKPNFRLTKQQIKDLYQSQQ
ncbi:hypothetical protein SAMD00019534_055170 [Acytostelium subglobosum LB1]|uniref:hypothetical protein n=1 Tax=Acytostelium subglobosum LB1 TaxID=1410327 RepID=UPI000644A761|nr:hypothetical protein SAMD00019534_055170 [Acytostelium subglobosum LB1]GAM22342.1 hypothetical protein SAMD00019534_055170 [Acytostelium subglobosum LB1]|eukprot:XP_012754462.1 hypothetical protein SAMD00019534_055170 [Acytostelium subglobosum LB1]